mgnify:FL=1
MQKAATVSNQTLSRENLETLLAAATEPLAFESCDFEGADLSRLALRSATFTNCSFVDVSFYSTDLSGSVWAQCRGRQADFEAATMVCPSLISEAT